MVPIISFVGYANSGKTTLITKILKILHERGYRVSVLKHHHGDLPMEEGKDTTKYMESGADKTFLLAENGYYVFKRENDPLEGIIDLATKDVDLLIVEGFKKKNLFKIEVQGDGYERLGIPVKALISNGRPVEDIPVFSHQEMEPLVVFLEDVMKKMKKK